MPRRPVALTPGFKGHTPFIRPVLATACDCISLCSKTTLNLWLQVNSAAGVCGQRKRGLLCSAAAFGSFRPQLIINNMSLSPEELAEKVQQ